MTNKQARAILINAAENVLGTRCEDEPLDLYYALGLAIDALDEVIKLEGEMMKDKTEKGLLPLDTFAPENRTDLRKEEHTAKVIVKGDEDRIYKSCSYCEQILEDGDTDGWEWSGCVGNYCQYCGAKFEDEEGTE